MVNPGSIIIEVVDAGTALVSNSYHQVSTSEVVVNSIATVIVHQVTSRRQRDAIVNAGDSVRFVAYPRSLQVKRSWTEQTVSLQLHRITCTLLVTHNIVMSVERQRQPSGLRPCFQTRQLRAALLRLWQLVKPATTSVSLWWSTMKQFDRTPASKVVVRSWRRQRR